MDTKKALELVNEMLEQNKRGNLRDVVNEFIKEIRSQHMAPLKKAIEDVQEELKKIDPHTKLPGTLLDKGGQMGEMGAMQSNLNPGAGADASTGIVKADPGSTTSQLHRSQHDWKGFMSKCMKTLTASEKKPAPLGKPYVSDAQRKKFHAMENRGEISHATVHEFDEASKGKKLPEHVHKAAESKHDRCVEHVKEQSPSVKNPHAVCVAAGVKPENPGRHMKKALGGVGAPSTPTSRPNAGFGAVIAKDDKPHPPGSPEERSHAVAEGMVSLPKAMHQVERKGHEAMHRFFNHLRTLKDPRKQRSPENNLTVKSEEKPENMKEPSKDAKDAIMASADKPMKVQPNRPGQANKPV